MQNDDTWRTLFHPFDAGVLDLPDPCGRVLFLGAQPGFRLPEGFAADLICVQGFRPDYLALQRQGRAVVAEPEGQDYDMAFVLAGKHRGQNEMWVAEALARVKPGSLVVVAASKKEGGDSLRKRMAELVGIEGHASKHHGTVLWLRAGEKSLPPVEAVQVGLFSTRPGMFSHGHVDAGSQLLAENLPADLKGDVADFCAGWGFLSGMLAQRDAVKSIDLYEADHASLEAAKAGLAGSSKQFGFFWHDLAAEKVTRRYDAIVMNPPFHAAGQRADPAIGSAIIAAAARALKGRGRLILVANRALPYERALAGLFAETGELVRDDKFKILWGSGPRTR